MRSGRQGQGKALACSSFFLVSSLFSLLINKESGFGFDAMWCGAKVFQVLGLCFYLLVRSFVPTSEWVGCFCAWLLVGISLCQLLTCYIPPLSLFSSPSLFPTSAQGYAPSSLFSRPLYFIARSLARSLARLNILQCWRENKLWLHS